MNTPPPPVLTPEVQVRLSTGQVVVVSEMPWPKMRTFLNAFAGLGNSLGDALRPAGPNASLAELGAGVLSRLPDLITGSTTLSEQLVRGCAPAVGDGRISEDALSASDFLRLLDASLTVTLNEEILRLGKSVAGRVRDAMVADSPSTRPSPAVSTPSLPVAGPTRTSVG